MDKSNLVNFLILPSIAVLLLLSMCSINVKNNSSEMAIAQASSTSNLSGSEPNKALLVMVSVKNPIIIPGTNQTLEFIVTDKETGQPISGANITGVSIYVNPHQVPFDIVTDSVGKASFSWKIPSFAAPGTYTIAASVFAKGYMPALGELRHPGTWTEFQVR